MLNQYLSSLMSVDHRDTMNVEGAQAKPHACRTLETVALPKVEKVAIQIENQDPRSVAATIISKNMRAVLVTIGPHQSFWSEHIIFFFLLQHNKPGVYLSLARNRELATFLYKVIFYSQDSYKLAEAMDLMVSIFPQIVVQGLPSDFQVPKTFVSEGFYFSTSASFLPSAHLDRGKSLLNTNPHFFFLRPTFDYVAAVIPWPALMFDPVKFRYPESKKYNLFNYEGLTDLSELKFDGQGISVYQSSNKLAQKYYKARARCQEWFQDLCSNHKFRYHPADLSEAQIRKKQLLETTFNEQTRKYEDLTKRVQAPQDRYQILNERFLFGIAHNQLNSIPQPVHPEFLNRELQIQLAQETLQHLQPSRPLPVYSSLVLERQSSSSEHSDAENKRQRLE